MVTTVGPPGRDIIGEALAADRLRLRDIIAFILSAVAPLTVVAGTVTTAFFVAGVPGIPLAFGIVAAALAVFSVGFVAMARRVRNAGALYTYAAYGLGKPVGVGAAFVAVVSYGILQLSLLGGIGVFTAGYAAQAGVDAPWWVWSLLAVLIMGGAGLLRVEFNGVALSIALGVEVVVTAVLTMAGVLHPAEGGLSWAGLDPSTLTWTGLGAALAVAMLGYVGFENAAVYSEETRSPRTVVPIATFAALATMAVVYMTGSWSMQVHWGTDQVAAVAAANGPETLFLMGPTALAWTGRCLLVTSMLAALLAFHNTTARYLFALGRERVLPARLATTSPRTGAPVTASLTLSVISLGVVVAYRGFGWDPLVKLFFWLSTAGAFGVLLLLILTSASVIGFFRHHWSGVSRWQRQISPALALLALGGIGLLVVRNYGTLVNAPPGSPIAWLFPAAFGVLFVLGLAYGGWLRTFAPRRYAQIGLGAKARTGQASVGGWR